MCKLIANCTKLLYVIIGYKYIKMIVYSMINGFCISPIIKKTLFSYLKAFHLMILLLIIIKVENINGEVFGEGLGAMLHILCKLFNIEKENSSPGTGTASS